MNKRKIIEIDEEKCDGCGQCILSCAEGALKLIDGKAKLVGDVYCDGLGACIGECPQGALKIIEREAAEFDEDAVEELLGRKEGSQEERPDALDVLPCGCPSSEAMELKPRSVGTSQIASAAGQSSLGHWPVKLQLLNPQSSYLKDADLVLLADCCAVAIPDLHGSVLSERVVAMGCPKLDDLQAHIDKLTQVLTEGKPRSLTVLHMEVPCCKGFVFAAEKALADSGLQIPLRRLKIARSGEVLEQEELKSE